MYAEKKIANATLGVRRRYRCKYSTSTLTALPACSVVRTPRDTRKPDIMKNESTQNSADGMTYTIRASEFNACLGQHYSCKWCTVIGGMRWNTVCVCV